MTIDIKLPCILLAEDEMMLAMMLEDRLRASGYRVLKAARLAKCLELADSQLIDLAILDINLAGEQSFPVAVVLRRQRAVSAPGRAAIARHLASAAAWRSGHGGRSP